MEKNLTNSLIQRASKKGHLKGIDTVIQSEEDNKIFFTLNGETFCISKKQLGIPHKQSLPVFSFRDGRCRLVFQYVIDNPESSSICSQYANQRKDFMLAVKKVIEEYSSPQDPQIKVAGSCSYGDIHGNTFRLSNE